MTAVEIAATLGDARREGRAWRWRCPLHRGRRILTSDRWTHPCDRDHAGAAAIGRVSQEERQ
jgi:hypothetical protein